jgi:hypothetical protein
MRTSACVVAVAALAARPTAARADGGYAARMIAIDATADTLIVAGMVSEHDWPIYAGLASYAVGGPILHAAHGEWPRAGVSLGVRVGLPLATGALGDAICIDDDGIRCIGSAAVGAALGMLAAQIIDPAVIVEDAADPTPAMLTIGGTF